MIFLSFLLKMDATSKNDIADFKNASCTIVIVGLSLNIPLTVYSCEQSRIVYTK
jgi:hypothetical protein